MNQAASTAKLVMVISILGRHGFCFILFEDIVFGKEKNYSVLFDGAGVVLIMTS